MIILEGSEYYEFIHVEQYGYVKSYNPKTTSGDHHHLMFIRGEDEMEVHLPIKPKAPGEQASSLANFFVILRTPLQSPGQQTYIHTKLSNHATQGTITVRITLMTQIMSKTHVQVNT